MIIFQIEKIFTKEEFLLMTRIMKPPAKLNLRKFYADIAGGMPYADCSNLEDIDDFLQKLAKVEESEIVILATTIQIYWAVRGTTNEQERLREIGLRYSSHVSKLAPDGWKYTD